jgi:hypothetical protein
MTVAVGKGQHQPGLADPLARFAAEQPARLAGEVLLVGAGEAPDEAIGRGAGADHLRLELEAAEAQSFQFGTAVAKGGRTGQGQFGFAEIGGRRPAEPLDIGAVGGEQRPVGARDRRRAVRPRRGRRGAG